MKSFAVFVSGSGSDLQSLIDGIEKKEIDGKISAIIASKAGIYALERAKTHGIKSFVFDKKEYASLEEMYEKLCDLLDSLNTDFIVLAGYLTIITPNIVHRFKDRILNIHPSLIPKYCGKGFYGIKVHQAVIENKEKFSGATVHFVDEGADTGKIIRQSKVKVLENDTAESLSKRVLKTEHRLLPFVVSAFCDGRIVQRGKKIVIKRKARLDL